MMKIPLQLSNTGEEFYKQVMETARNYPLPKNFNRRGLVSSLASFCFSPAYESVRRLVLEEIFIEFPEKGVYSNKTKEQIGGIIERDFGYSLSHFPWVLVFMVNPAVSSPAIISWIDETHQPSYKESFNMDFDTRINAPYGDTVQ